MGWLGCWYDWVVGKFLDWLGEWVRWIGLVRFWIGLEGLWWVGVEWCWKENLRFGLESLDFGAKWLVDLIINR